MQDCREEPPPNTALAATGHSAGFCVVQISVGVARASPSAFGL